MAYKCAITQSRESETAFMAECVNNQLFTDHGNLNEYDDKIHCDIVYGIC